MCVWGGGGGRGKGDGGSFLSPFGFQEFILDINLIFFPSIFAMHDYFFLILLLFPTIIAFLKFSLNFCVCLFILKQQDYEIQFPHKLARVLTILNHK